VVELPSSGWRPGDPSHLAAWQGVVHGSPAVGPGCVWLEPNPGSRHPIAWPTGFYARFDPLRVYDGAGHVVAREGQRIRVGGGLGSAAGLRCMLGRPDVFYVQSGIQVIGGSGWWLVLGLIIVGLVLLLLFALIVRRTMRRRTSAG
jgi:hypothetical protein